jgi:hypothetical protein
LEYDEGAALALNGMLVIPHRGGIILLHHPISSVSFQSLQQRHPDGAFYAME